jgi:hypothetical protein
LQPDAPFSAPKLTLPPAEEAAVRDAYGQAKTILEYGSGGSTLIAAETAGATVFSVESDAAWAAMMKAWFVAHPPKAKVIIHHADIGPTKAWGMPINNAKARLWSGYPNGVWDRPDFVAPDIVLIDGRFRLACFLTVLFRCTKPVTVLWDDYIDRPGYHAAEKLLKPVRMIGRMAEYKVAPMAVPPQHFGWISGAFFHTQ